MALSLERYTRSQPSAITSILKERTERARKKLRTIEINNGDVLPEDLIVEMLSWLPVKALLQFKVVCKRWYAIITSSPFISKHLINYYNNNDSWCDCLLAHHFDGDDYQVIELLVEKTRRVLAFEALRNVPNYNWVICGPCDGLYYTWCWFRDNERALWNPALNEFKALPPIITNPANLPSNRSYGPRGETYGFGSDPISKDYKVIVIKEYCNIKEQVNTNDPLAVFIYSLRTNSWRYWGDLKKYYDLVCCTNTCYTFVHGCYYWIGSYERHSCTFHGLDVIVSFDMVSDTYQEIQVPNYGKPVYKNLGKYHDSIAIYVVHKMDKYLDIWTLNNGGIWTKKFTMGHLPEAYYPLGHWRDNKILLAVSNYSSSKRDIIILCDPDTQEIRHLAYELEFDPDTRVLAYMESLVSIKDQRSKNSRFD